MNYIVYEVSLICSDSNVYSILANNKRSTTVSKEDETDENNVKTDV